MVCDLQVGSPAEDGLPTYTQDQLVQLMRVHLTREEQEMLSLHYHYDRRGFVKRIGATFHPELRQPLNGSGQVEYTPDQFVAYIAREERRESLAYPWCPAFPSSILLISCLAGL